MQYFNLFSKYRIPIATGLIFVLGIFIYSFKDSNQVEDLFLDKLNSNHNGLEMIEPERQDQENDSEVSEEISELQIVIDVAGEVVKPSVYLLPEGTRIFQAIEAAGGLGPKADTSNVNLAAILYDGSKLYIPKKNEKVNVVQTSSNQGSFDISAEPGKVNINTADSTELQKLSGVGPATAEKILAYRRDYGRFNKIEDLMNVSGIGEKTFAKLKSQISIN